MVGVLLMKLLALLLFLAVLLGPLRRPFFRNARFTVPAAVAAVAGLAVGSVLVAKAGLSGLAALLVPFAIACSLASAFGKAFKGWCNEVFGEEGRHNDRH